MVTTSTSQTLYSCKSSSRVSGAGYRDPSLRATKNESRAQAMTLFINVGSLRSHQHCRTASLTFMASEASSLWQLRKDIYSLLGIPQHFKAELLHKGRTLTEQSTAATSLKSLRLANYDTLTLVSSELFGGSKEVDKSQLELLDKDDSQLVSGNIDSGDLDEKNENEETQIKLVEKIKTNFYKTTSLFFEQNSLVKKSDIDIKDKDDSVAVDLLAPNVPFSETQPQKSSQGADGQENAELPANQADAQGSDLPEDAGLSYEWANVESYAAEMLKNSQEEVSDQKLIDQALSQAQEKLIEKHGVPKVNVALENIAEIILDLKKKIGQIIDESTEQEFNQQILEMYEEFDVSNKGYLLYNEFLAYLSFICRELRISIDEKTMHIFAKAIDRNGDSMYHKDEIVHIYSGEERKEWFARKRKEAESNWLEKKKVAQKYKLDLQKDLEAKQKIIEEKRATARAKKEDDAKKSDGDSAESGQEGDDHSGSGSNSDDEHAQDYEVCSNLSDFSEYEKFSKKKEQEADEEAENSGSDTAYGENCFTLLFRLKSEQDKTIKEFSDKMHASDIIRTQLYSIMDRISQTEAWYGKISSVQINLLKALLYEALENSQLDISLNNDCWYRIVKTCDLKCLIEIIVCLGPNTFRDSTNKNERTLELIGFMESAKNERLIIMLLESIKSLQDEIDLSKVFESINQYFRQANVAQKRLILNLTCNQRIKAQWIELLSPEKILSLLTFSQDSEQMENFAQLALCSNDKLKAINELMTPKQKKQWSTWQLVSALGNHKSTSLELLESQNQGLVRTINLPSDSKCLFQLPHESRLGHFYRVEQHKRQHDAVFTHAKSTDRVEIRKNEDTSYLITHLKYSKISKRHEPIRQHETDQPITIQNGSLFPHTRPLLFSGENGRVFWFTKTATSSEIRINILNDNSEHEQHDIPETSFLYTYLSVGNQIIEESIGDTAMFPMAEPNLIMIQERLYLAYSYFRLGMTPSVILYSLSSKKDVIQFQGASMFVQKHQDQLNKVDEDNHNIHNAAQFTLMLVEEMCKNKKIVTEMQMKSTLEQCENSGQIFMNLFVSHKQLNVDTMQVIDIGSELEDWKKKYGSEDEQEVLKAQKNEKIQLVVSDSVKLEEEFFQGGQYKVLRHAGHQDEQYLILQNTEERAKQCLVYEVKNRNEFKLKFNFRKQDSYDVDETRFQFVQSKPKSKPLLLLLDYSDNAVQLLDMLKDFSNESDKEETESEKLQTLARSAHDISDDEAEDLLFSKALIPDSIQSSEEIQNLHSQPVLVDDSIIFSALDINKKYFDVSIERKPDDEDTDQVKVRRGKKKRYEKQTEMKSRMKYEGEISTDEESQEVFGVTHLNQFESNLHAWKFSFSYPLLASVNPEIAGGMIIANMANGVKEQVLLQLNDLGQFISFVDKEKVDAETEISFLTYDHNSQQLKLCNLIFEQVHKKGVILFEQEWTSKTRNLSKQSSLNKIYEMRDKIKSIRLFNKSDRDDDDFALLCQTDKEILFMTAKTGSITEVFSNKGDQRIADVNIIQSQNGQSYFIIEEMSSQTNFIYEFGVSCEKATEKFLPSFQKVYTFSMGTVIHAQLNRDTEQLCSNDYTHEGEVQTIQTSSRCNMMVLDSNSNFLKLSQKNSGANFEQIDCHNMTKESGLMTMLQHKTPEDSLIMSDRTIIMQDQVLAISSGKTHNALEGYLSADSKVLACQMVPGSDKVMYKVQNDNNHTLALKRDAGLRNCNPIGQDGLRDCLSANFISKDLILFQMKGVQQEGNYWTYITVDEQIKELPHLVADQLKKEDWTKVESRIVRGSVCQLLLFKQKFEEDENKFMCQEKDKDWFKAKIIELTSDGEFLSVKDIMFSETKCDEMDLIQNQAGQLLQVNVFFNHGDQNLQETATFTPGDAESDKENLSPQQIVFENCFPDIQYVYAGDYFCWIKPSQWIKAIDLTETKEKRVVKEIKLSNESKKLSNFVTISPAMPYSVIRMSQESIIDEELVKKYSNFVQMTTDNHALLYNLNDKDPKPENEIAALQQLSDPQNFVDPGMTIVTNEQKHSAQWTVEDFGLIQGKLPFGVKTWLEPWQKGGIIMMKQKSNLPQSKTHITDIKFRPVVGFYKEQCEADLMEVRSLIKDAENGIKPKRIDIRALWAQYGNTIFFALLLGNLRILTAINECLGQLELEDCEDTDGTETYNPDLRRLGDILMRKTCIETSADYQIVQIKSFLQEELANSGLRDAILKIGRQCPSFSILKLFVEQKDFKTMMKSGTAQTTIELQNCFSETRSTRQIQLLNWPRDMNLLTLRSDRCTITKEELDDKLEGEENRITRTVKVSTTDLRWFYRDGKHFIQFTEMLQNLPNRVYDTIFVESLLDLFWDKTQKQIIVEQFLPYLLFVLMTLWLFVQTLSERNDQVEGSNVTPQWRIYLGAAFELLLWLKQVRNELKQMFTLEKKRYYFKKLWNVTDFTSLSLTMIILVASVPKEALISPEILRQFAAFASCTLLIKVYDWLKLFETTAFYILLLDETMRDVSSFLILIFTALMMFGMPMIMLNLNSIGDNSIVDEPFAYWTVNMLLNQYLLALGEFNIDNFAVHPQAFLCYLFFFLATFVTQIAMLNMMIAIMADTFERVIENREVNATRMKLDLMSDMVATLQYAPHKMESDGFFMFIVQPDDDQTEEGDDWEGSINKITRLTGNNINQLGQQIHKKSDRLQDSINDFMRKDQIQDKHLKAHIDKIVKSSQKEINQKIKTLQEQNEKAQKENEKASKEMKSFMQNMQAQIMETLGQKNNPDSPRDTKANRRGSFATKIVANSLKISKKQSKD